jgi:hypothetical protein
MEGLRNVKGINEQITIGNGYTMVAAKLGDLKYEVTQVNGSKFEATLKEEKYVSKLWVNLFSIKKEVKYRFNLSNDGVSIRLAKGLVSLCFDFIIPSSYGFVNGVIMSAIHSETT